MSLHLKDFVDTLETSLEWVSLNLYI